MKTDRVTQTDINKALITELLSISDSQQIEIQRFYHPEFIEHNTNSAVNVHGGREGVQQAFQIFGEAFPERSHILDDIIAENDKVVARITFRGRFQKNAGKREADGKDYEASAIAIYRFKDGKIIEKWTNFSVLEFLKLDKKDLI